LVPATIAAQIIKGRRPFKAANDAADIGKPMGRSVAVQTDRVCQRAACLLRRPLATAEPAPI